MCVFTNTPSYQPKISNTAVTQSHIRTGDTKLLLVLDRTSKGPLRVLLTAQMDNFYRTSIKQKKRGGYNLMHGLLPLVVAPVPFQLDRHNSLRTLTKVCWGGGTPRIPIVATGCPHEGHTPRALLASRPFSPLSPSHQSPPTAQVPHVHGVRRPPRLAVSLPASSASLSSSPRGGVLRRSRKTHRKPEPQGKLC